MSRFSLHIGLRDCGAMTCDYDNDHFNRGLKFQHSWEVVMVNGHGQKAPKSCVTHQMIEV